MPLPLWTTIWGVYPEVLVAQSCVQLLFNPMTVSCSLSYRFSRQNTGVVAIPSPDLSNPGDLTWVFCVQAHCYHLSHLALQHTISSACLATESMILVHCVTIVSC